MLSFGCGGELVYLPGTGQPVCGLRGPSAYLDLRCLQENAQRPHLFAPMLLLAYLRGHQLALHKGSAFHDDGQSRSKWAAIHKYQPKQLVRNVQ
jgi:hypothetical protein